MSTSLPVYISFGALVISLVCLALQFVVQHRLKKFWAGKKGHDLEEMLEQIIAYVERLDNRSDVMHSHITDIDARVKHAVMDARAIRFNAFSDTGGNQSFAIALLDENGTGIIISSLYSREKTSVFAKPITAYTSTYDLTEEEKEVLHAKK